MNVQRKKRSDEHCYTNFCATAKADGDPLLHSSNAHQGSLSIEPCSSSIDPVRSLLVSMNALNNSCNYILTKWTS